MSHFAELIETVLNQRNAYFLSRLSDRPDHSQFQNVYWENEHKTQLNSFLFKILVAENAEMSHVKPLNEWIQ